MLDLIETQKLPGQFSLQTLQNTIGVFLTKPQNSPHDCTCDCSVTKIRLDCSFFLSWYSFSSAIVIFFPV